MSYFYPFFVGLSVSSRLSNHLVIPLYLHILAFLLGIVFPAVLFASSRRTRGRGPGRWSQRMKTHLYYGNGLVLFTLAGLVLVAWWLTGRPFTDLGLGWGSPPYDGVAVALLAAFFGLYLLEVYRELATPRGRARSRVGLRKIGFMPSTPTQFLNFIFLSVAAGFSEEIVFRGFLMTYLQELLPPEPWRPIAVILLPAVSFGLGHFYQGGRAVLKIVVMAVLFGFFFLRTGTLWPLMLLHAAVDVFGGFVSWYLLGYRDD